jgi:hypothetical protein
MRLLFLVDREQWAEQAIAALQDLFGGEYRSYWLKPGMAMQHKQITVCLLQTMIGRHAEFSSGSFDVVIADECHRSIYGAWQAALTHFDALHIGLTATPAAYIGRNTYQFGKLGPDVKGDIFEYLLQHLSRQPQSDMGQFRTPRQIRVAMVAMVAMVDPDLGDTICDWACGTAGLLVDSVEYILAKYSTQPQVLPARR